VSKEGASTVARRAKVYALPFKAKKLFLPHTGVVEPSRAASRMAGLRSSHCCVEVRSKVSSLHLREESIGTRGLRAGETLPGADGTVVESAFRCQAGRSRSIGHQGLEARPLCAATVQQPG
jgi:hypothetical protein